LGPRLTMGTGGQPPSRRAASTARRPGGWQYHVPQMFPLGGSEARYPAPPRPVNGNRQGGPSAASAAFVPTPPDIDNQTKSRRRVPVRCMTFLVRDDAEHVVQAIV